MMKNYSLAAAALLAIFPAVAHAQAAPAAPAPVTLRLKFTPGQTLYYSMVSDTNGTVLMGQSGAGMPIQVHTQDADAPDGEERPRLRRRGDRGRRH